MMSLLMGNLMRNWNGLLRANFCSVTVAQLCNPCSNPQARVQHVAGCAAAKACSVSSVFPAFSTLLRQQQLPSKPCNVLDDNVPSQIVSLQTASHMKPEAFKVPIYACHLGYELEYQAFCVDFKFRSRSTGRDNALLEIGGELSKESLLLGADREERPEKIMLVYRYGSVIFFNMRASERDMWLTRLQAYVKGPNTNFSALAPGGSLRRVPPPLAALRHDETLVVVRPGLDTWSALEPDKIVVQALSVGNVRVIGHVLGQSVALDYYNSKVDEAIQLFTPYLRDVASSGRCVNVREARLLQLIAENSLLYTDVITKIGLLDISQTAWTQDRYHELWQSLRVDYEIDRRFDAINRKLGPMLENAKFLLEIRAEKKSVEAEWIIIGLICLEVVVNIYGHFLL